MSNGANVIIKSGAVQPLALCLHRLGYLLEYGVPSKHEKEEQAKIKDLQKTAEQFLKQTAKFVQEADEAPALAADAEQDMGQIPLALAFIALFSAGQKWYEDKSNPELQDDLIKAFGGFIRMF